MTPRYPRTIHVLVSGTTVPGDGFSNHVASRGEQLTISEEQYEDSRDRHGSSWLDLTPSEQVERYGVQRWADGPTPEGITLGDDDPVILALRAQKAWLESRGLR